MTIEQQVALYLLHLDQRVSRLETLEQPAGGVGGGDLFLVETVTLAAQGIIQITNIPATAKHLFYTGFLKAVNGTTMALIINAGASAGDLSSLAIMVCGGATSGLTTVGSVRMGVTINEAGVARPSDVYSALWGWVPDIQDTSNKTGTIAWSGVFQRDDFAHALWQGRGGGNWDKAAAITQIDLVHDGVPSTQFEAGSRFSLYGLIQ